MKLFLKRKYFKLMNNTLKNILKLNRRYRVIKYDFVLNRSKIEKLILLNPNIINENGEWIKKENAIEIFEKICFIPR